MNSRKLYNILAISTLGSSLALASVVSLHYFSNRKLVNYIIANAQKYVGIKEIGGDDKGFSDKVFEYKLRQLGWQSGWDWCAFFVKLVLLETFSQLQLPQHWHFVKDYFSASTQRTWQNFRQHKRAFFRLDEKPRKGSVAMWRNIHNRFLGHTGIVIETDGQLFRTIEGNRYNDVGYMNRSLSAYTNPDGKLQLLGFINFKI